MPALSFKYKLLLAMMLVVVGVTGATLFAVQTKNQQFFRTLYGQIFAKETGAFFAHQKLRYDAIKDTGLSLAGSVRVQFALEEGESETLYLAAKAELEARQVLQGLTFFLFLDHQGEIIAPPESFGPSHSLARQPRLRQQLAQAGQAVAEATEPLLSYITLMNGQDEPQLGQAVFTKVVLAATGEILGMLALGFPVIYPGSEAADDSPSGIFFDDRLHSQSLPAASRVALADRLKAEIPNSEVPSERFVETVNGEPCRVFYQAINPETKLAPAHLVLLISLTEQMKAQRDLRGLIFLFGGIGVAGALMISTLLSQGLAGPIEELVKGTGEIQKGNFEVNVAVRSRDEIGRLTTSFNEMAKGLALKERYREVLNMVSDKEVAEELMQGKIALGGETRDISVLFCDIRGFTALTYGMDPPEVIRMLNEHFTPLTRVVNEFHGVVDKFVGDLIMAIFGAPKSYGNDAENAVRCALAMIHERQKLNETSRYQIQVGIGVASGPAVAGRMGSSDRLNYTVLGERVNLASRLCGKAGRMEVVIDQTSYERLKDKLDTEPLGELDLKGFSDRVHAYKLLNMNSKVETL